jgi:hypothetical protein
MVPWMFSRLARERALVLFVASRAPPGTLVHSIGFLVHAGLITHFRDAPVHPIAINRAPRQTNEVYLGKEPNYVLAVGASLSPT